ncbi:hypothetical protein LPH57_11570 [Xylella taiwanensis]|nr:hypothetical protein [Xylella taiwanensis]UFN41244.1 hypothetical protein LPH57_11570 [Xylella taiwanensis]UFS49385.1 hypothetical protein LPH54_10630 [Xylella taiwanensis]
MIITIGMAVAKSAVPVSVTVLTSDVIIEVATCLYILLQAAHLLWKWRVDWKKRKVKKGER